MRILKGKKLKRPGKEEKRVMYFWTSHRLLPDNCEYLKSLPRQADMTIGTIRIGLFHGTYDDDDEMLFPDSPERRFRKLAKDAPYRVHIMGHSHTPFYKSVGGVHFINPGSVGRMFDGDPRASFAVLDICSEEIDVVHYRIPYPVEKVILGLKQNRLPDIYAKMYLTGRKLN